MRSNPQLEPKTKEIWTGIRNPLSSVSEIQDQINALKSRVSGIVDYQEFLKQGSVDSFDSYESALKTRSDDFRVSEGQVADIVATVETAFSSFSSFTGDAGNDTGIFALTSYDEYRTYLTNNGVSQIPADEHNQVIQDLFTSDTLLIRRITEDFDSWQELRTWLIDNGWSEAEADEFIQQLKDEFDSFQDFKDFVSGLSSLDELLNELNHNQGAPAGQPGVKVQDGDLILSGQNIRMRQQAPDEQTSPDPPPDGSVDWTLQTASQTVARGATIPIEATGSSSATQTFQVTVALTVGGTVADVATVNVVDGNTSVSFSVTFDEIGEQEFRIGNSGTATITVTLPGGG